MRHLLLSCVRKKLYLLTLLFLLFHHIIGEKHHHNLHLCWHQQNFYIEWNIVDTHHHKPNNKEKSVENVPENVFSFSMVPDIFSGRYFAFTTSKIFAWNDTTRYGFSHHVSELERRRMLLLVISIYEYFYPILRRYLDQISVDERNSEKLKWCLLWWWRKNWFSSSLLCMVYWLLCVCYDSIGLFTNLSWLKCGSPLFEWNQMI